MKNISFGGIKNTGFLYMISPETIKLNTGKEIIDFPKYRHIDFHAELTNKNERDLDTFQSLLQEYPNETNPNAIHISQDDFVRNDTGTLDSVIQINDKNVELNDNTLNGVIKLFNLTKKISETKFQQNTADDDYKYSYDILNDYKLLAKEYLYKTPDGELNIDAQFFNDINNVCNAQSVKNGSDYFKKVLSQILQRFFEEN